MIRYLPDKPRRQGQGDRRQKKGITIGQGDEDSKVTSDQWATLLTDGTMAREIQTFQTIKPFKQLQSAKVPK